MDLADLLAIPGIKEECILRSNVGFLALHGGSQDRGTDQIARRAAEEAGASYYAIVQPPGLRVHLTSRLHDPRHSAKLRSFCAHVDVAISVHGFGRDSFALWHDPGRGLIVEAYGPAMRGAQTGPLRGIILGGRNAPLLEAARGEALVPRQEGLAGEVVIALVELAAGAAGLVRTASGECSEVAYEPPRQFDPGGAKTPPG